MILSRSAIIDGESDRPDSPAIDRLEPRWTRQLRLLSTPMIDILFGSACLGAFYLRLIRLLAVPGVVGGDHANFLTVGHRLIGQKTQNGGSIYPPLVPLLVLGARSIGDVRVTLPVLSALAGTLPALGIYLAFRHLSNRAAVAAAAGLLLMAGSVSEAVAWGGTPQLIGLGAMPIALVGITKIARRDESVSLWTTSGALLALFAATHFVAIFFVLATIPLLIPILWTTLRAKILMRLLIVGAPSLLLFPIYYILVRDLSTVTTDYRDTQNTLSERVNYVLSDNSRLWLTLLFAAAVCLLLGIGSWRRAEYQVAVSVGSIAFLFNIFSYEPRYAYFVSPAVVIAIVVIVGTVGPSQRLYSRILLCASLLAVGVSAWLAGSRYFPRQVAFYASVSPTDSGLVALDWLRTSTPADSVVAVPSIHQSPIGWWVEGYGQRRTLVEGDLSLLNFAEERDRSRAASRIFRPDPDLAVTIGPQGPALVISEQSIRRAQSLGVNYLVIFRRSDEYNAQNIADLLLNNPRLLAFETQDVIILAIPPVS